MSSIVPNPLRCFAVSPAPTFVLRSAAARAVAPAPTVVLRGSAGQDVLRSLRGAAVVASASGSFTLGFPGGAVGARASVLAVRAGGYVRGIVALPSWLRSRASLLHRSLC